VRALSRLLITPWHWPNSCGKSGQPSVREAVKHNSFCRLRCLLWGGGGGGATLCFLLIVQELPVAFNSFRPRIS
jgi:hypothetical protein